MTAPRINEPLAPPEPDPPFDPLRLCIFTTIALIAWVVSPSVAVLGFSALAIRGYARARRAGLLRSRCLLGDTRLVLAYLGLAFTAAAVAVGWRIAGWVT